MLAADVHSHCQGSEEITVEEEFHAFHFVHKCIHTSEVDRKQYGSIIFSFEGDTQSYIQICG